MVVILWKKLHNQEGYLVLEGLVSFFLVTGAVFLYFPIVLNLLQHLESEKESVEINRKLYEEAQFEVEAIQQKNSSYEKGLELYGQGNQEIRRIYQISILVE
ncbi:hypothetical protein ACWOFR_01445 [Carnobacterium gallinarum]|uniref:hypothetical protein n=1 Tax=Carnobacterium gallinarum TaxID=2749 RepID=UPI001B80227F|nr:hypothetical protein [Carnobacterium gallinarum]